MASVDESLNTFLKSFNVEVNFSNKAIEDLASYTQDMQEKILALIVARAKNGPLIKPKGIGEPLHGDLHGFTKIKPKHLALRIIYRPSKQGKLTVMEVIAIGPRDRDKVYTMAAKRLVAFKREMNQRRQDTNTGQMDDPGDA